MNELQVYNNLWQKMNILPCIACINTDGNLDRNNNGTEVDIDSNK